MCLPVWHWGWVVRNEGPQGELNGIGAGIAFRKGRSLGVGNPIIDEGPPVEIDGAVSGNTVIRYVQPKNNQRAKVNWHEDFSLDAKLTGL